MKRLSSHRLHRPVRWAVVAALTIALGWAFSPPALTVDAATTKAPWQTLTLSRLTAVWWQWIYSIHASDSPLDDSTGAHATVNQPYYSAPGGNGDLFFLAGTGSIIQLQNGDLLGQVTRAISVKQGTAFFFPLLNAEFDNVCSAPHLGGNCFKAEKFPHVLGVSQLQALVTALIDNVTGLNATLTPTDANFQATGPPVNMGYQRLQSPPFSYTLPATGNSYQASGINVSGTVAPAVSDGYWSFIQGTLAAGYYTLQFGGSIPDVDGKGHSFTEVITYHITVTP